MFYYDQPPVSQLRTMSDEEFSDIVQCTIEAAPYPVEQKNQCIDFVQALVNMVHTPELKVLQYRSGWFLFPYLGPVFSLQIDRLYALYPEVRLDNYQMRLI
jgi:hypothetical protein